jgi:hypothetical protein
VSSIDAYIITAICLYSTGHWIGGSVATVLAAWGAYQIVQDPTGMKRLTGLLRS